MKDLLRNADQYCGQIEAKTRRWLCYKDSPAAPAAPDYTGAAYAQGAANVETARAQGRISNPNIYTPYGTQTVSWGNSGSGTNTPSGGSGGTWGAPTPIYGAPDDAGNQGAITGYNAPIWTPDASGGASTGGSSTGGNYSGDQPTITQTLSPAQQQLLDAQNRISGNLAGIAESGLNRVGTGLGTPFDASGINPVQTSAGVNPQYQGSVGYNPLQTSYDRGGNVQYGNGYGGQIQNSFNQGGPLQYGTGYNGQIQGNINTNGVQGIPVVDAAARQHAEDLAYRAATSRLDPQWAQRNAMQDTQLRNQGLVAGGEAYDAAKRDQGYQQNDAYLQAQQNAVTQGLTNQQAQFGMGLAANQTGFGQAQAQGQFQNAAQAQGYGQALGNANLYNAAQGQAYGQNLGAAQFANTAQNQGFTQAQAQQAAYNAAQAQANAQNQSQAAFGNQATQNQFNMGLQNANLGNQVGQQQFQQGLANANLGNAASQQQIQQQAYLRSLPLNELNALRTGAQVQNPQFQPYQGSNIGQTPIFGAAQAQGTADQNIYNAQTGAANSFNTGLASVAGMAAMYF